MVSRRPAPGAAPAPSDTPVTVPKPLASAAAKPAKPGKVPVIVGIGASAGGLDALERFFKNVPVRSGIAFVVIQHLDPNQKGMLPELLQRITPMQVQQVKSRTKVKPDSIYVIPPNKNLSVRAGTLHLSAIAAGSHLRLPIDSFLRSLAEDQRDRAVGVILSGMGSDGTEGLRAIRKMGGLTLAQEAASAKFDSMPRSVINAGLVDVVAGVEQLPVQLIDHLQLEAAELPEALAPEIPRRSALETIVYLLQERTGNDFSFYKKNTVLRRIERRMSLHQIDTMEKYASYLRDNAQELDLLFKELLIGVTNFFRDPAVWECLKEVALPGLLAQHPAGKALRAWVPACSSGEEAYTLAIIFKEVLAKLHPKGRFSLQVFATDLDPDAIARARQGLYPTSIVSSVSPERLSRYFIAERDGYRICKEIREMVIFAPQNVIMDPPFTKLDMLTCRNLLIYFSAELQAKLLPLFHYALNRQGILLLGNAETIGNHGNLFTPLDNKARLYRRSETGLRSAIDFPTKLITPIPIMQDLPNFTMSTVTLQHQAEQLLLQNFSPAGVLVTGDGDIVYINGRTGKYLEPAAGKANWNVYAMAREGLRLELALALKKALRQQETVTLEHVQIPGNKGVTHQVKVSITPIDKPDQLRGMAMIVFVDLPALAAIKATATKGGAEDNAQMAELQYSREEMQTMREEMQTSQEELTATNEELQSINEELQSTNEEMTTSKEEMQSLNEELQVVNAELQSKLDELSRANNDMKNLLNSTDIATIFLDNNFHIRRFTTHATGIFRLIAGDIGRPLSDIATDLCYPELQNDVNSVLSTLMFSEKQIVTNDKRWFKVRIMPYRTQDNVIDGVVMTFADITAFKNLEVELRSRKK